MGLNKETETDGPLTKRGVIVFIMILGAFLTALNQTVMSVATPVLMNDLDISAATAQWLTTGYMLVNGVLIPITAFLMKRFPTRQLFQSSMITFLAGTIISALAFNFPILLAGRVIQAAGAGVMIPLLYNVVLTLYPPAKRGTIMGMVSLAILFAPAIGPTLAGYVLEVFPWQVMFFGLVPLIVMLIIFAHFYLQNVSKTARVKVDVQSVILSTTGFAGLLYGFSAAGNGGWSSTEVIVSLLVGIIGLSLFTWRQLVSVDPLLDLRTFKYKMFTLTNIINIGITIIMYADMILLPLYLQNARGYTAMESGLLMLPGAILMGLLSPVSGKLYDRYGAKWITNHWYIDYDCYDNSIYSINRLNKLYVSPSHVYWPAYRDGLAYYANTNSWLKSNSTKPKRTRISDLEYDSTSSRSYWHFSACHSDDKQYQ